MARQQQLGTRYAAGQSPVASIWDDTKQWREENLLGDIATSFIPGIAQAGAIQDAQTDFGQGNYGMGTLAALGAVPGLGAVTKPIRAGIKAADKAPPKLLPYQQKRKDLIDEWKGYGEDVDVTFHNSRGGAGIGDGSLNYRAPNAAEKVKLHGNQKGIFGHEGNAFPEYGEDVYGIISRKGPKGPGIGITSGPVDTVDRRIETFVPENLIQETQYLGKYADLFGG